MSKRHREQVNPEILREEQERHRAHLMYDDEEMGVTLFPEYNFMGSTASSTESTGLIQVIPLTPDQLKAYDNVYSYRQERPIADKDDKYE